jgi:hypothetical protein
VAAAIAGQAGTGTVDLTAVAAGTL